MKVLIFLIVCGCIVFSAGSSHSTDAVQTPTDQIEAEQLRDILGSNAAEPAVDAALLEQPQQADVPQSSIIIVLGRLVLSLVIVVGAIYGVAYVGRKFYSRARSKGSKDSLVFVVDKAHLDSKKTVYLVKVVDRLLVIGAGTNEVRVLSTLKDQAVVDSVKTTDFSYHLKDFFGSTTNRVVEQVQEQREVSV